MKTIGEFNNENADILAGSNEKFQEVVASFWQIFAKVFHTFAGLTKFSNAIN